MTNEQKQARHTYHCSRRSGDRKNDFLRLSQWYGYVIRRLRYTPYRFQLPSKTAYYLHLDRIMHPNFDRIKIGVLIWLG